MTEEEIKTNVMEEMRALLPSDTLRPTITVQEPTEDDKRHRRLNCTIEMPNFDEAAIRGLAESLIRKHLGKPSN